MSLSDCPELRTLMNLHLSESDASEDERCVADFSRSGGVARTQKAASQARALLTSSSLSLEELGAESNRWFSELEEAQAWLSHLVQLLDAQGGGVSDSRAAPEVLEVKDSNGTPLSEGDSVQVIKDLKVRGGSSDLKRGTLIKKIHLTDDPEAIECRVEGSTLVLKTCFLKKA